MSVIGFVPLKGNSEGLPNKNVNLFCGMPLFYWVINEMLKSSQIDFVYVSSDLIDVLDQVRECFSNYSAWLSKLCFFHEGVEKKPYWDKAAADFCKGRSGDDVLIMAQVTSPFTQQIDFEKALELYRSRNCGSIVSCTKTHRFVWQGKTRLFSSVDMIPINYSIAARPRRQEFEGTLIENGAIYINSAENLKRYGVRLSYPVSVYLMPEYTYTEIDTEDDWYYAEYLFRKYVLEKK